MITDRQNGPVAVGRAAGGCGDGGVEEHEAGEVDGPDRGERRVDLLLLGAEIRQQLRDVGVGRERHDERERVGHGEPPSLGCVLVARA